MTGRWGVIVPTAVAVVLVAALTWLIVAASGEHDRWTDWCRAQGGHVVDHTETTTTVVINPNNGQPGVGTGSSTTYYCLSGDGRILDIQ